MTTAIDRLARMPAGQTYDQSICLTCPDEPQFETEELPDHLAEVHHVSHGATGICTLLPFTADTYDFYVNVYRWDIEGVEVEQYLQTPRHAESKVYWREGIAL